MCGFHTGQRPRRLMIIARTAGDPARLANNTRRWRHHVGS
jgi:hypothetical protein